jgi:hypothetical protein
VAAKIREDPLFAIKQQEAAAYEALMSNPLKLKELKARSGGKDKDKDKKERKKERKERKERERKERGHRSPSPLDNHERHSRSRRSPSPYERRDRSPYGSRNDRDRSEVDRDRLTDTRDRRPRDDHTSRREPDARARDHDHDSRARRLSDSHPRRPEPAHDAPGHDDRTRRPPWPRSDESESPPTRGRSPSYTRGRPADVPSKRVHSRSRSPPPPPREPAHKRARTNPPPPPAQPQQQQRPAAADDRAARLAAMSRDAGTADVERRARLAALLAREKAEAQTEQATRAKSGGMGSFLSHESKKVFGGQGGLEDRLRRGRAGLVAERE